MKIYTYHGRCNLCGNNVRRFREDQSLTQDQLAARLQLLDIPLTQKAVSRIETGERVVADYELVFIAEALQVPVNRLLDDKR